MQRRPQAKKLLVLSQVFVPDPASVGQHMADVAFEMARRGFRVRVCASARGYDDPTRRYSFRQTLQGAEIRRLPLTSFGKKFILLRILATASFMVQAFLTALLTPDVDAIFFSTSPPLIGVIAAMAGLLRRIPIAYWAMDLNPDQLIAIGKLSASSPAARLLESVNRFILRRTSLIIALDRFMADRLRRRGYPGQFDRKMLVMPPWPHEEAIRSVDSAANPFRRIHGLAGKFVFMYSGNHSPANPLDTFLQAACHFRDDDDMRFLFVGGGVAKKGVEAFIRDHRLVNAISLPYQPLEQLRYSLTAADVHIVTLGQEMVGIVHPCKIYGAMTAGRPILFFGPSPSHISDLLDKYGFGWHVNHDDIAGAIATIDRIRHIPSAQLHSLGDTAQRLVVRQLSQTVLTQRFCDAMESSLFPDPPTLLQ